MYDFYYYAPTYVAFGKNSLSKLQSLLQAQGCKRVLLVYGGQSAVKSGLIAIVRSALDGAGAQWWELSGVVPNPRLSLVYEGIEIGKRENVDFILAVGGGSVIDTAKAVGYGLANEGDVWDFYAGKRRPAACLALGTVLTLSAAGSEMSNSSVITNEDGWLKRSCNTEYARPKFSVLDPTLTMTCPDYQTASGCVDILMHTMERYFTSGGNMKLTDGVAEALMRTVIENALKLKANPNDYDARAEIMWASSLSHNGLTGCGNNGGDWVPHGLEHELGGLYDVAHGAGLAAVWGSWARYVCQNAMCRFHTFAIHVMGVRPSGTKEEIVYRGIEAMEEFFTKIGMPINLPQLGVHPTEEELRLLAKKAAAACGGKKGSAKVVYEEDMYNIYKAAAQE